MMWLQLDTFKDVRRSQDLYTIPRPSHGQRDASHNRWNGTDILCVLVQVLHTSSHRVPPHQVLEATKAMLHLFVTLL